jgi:site-specific DNA-cytosine methylase
MLYTVDSNELRPFQPIVWEYHNMNGIKLYEAYVHHVNRSAVYVMYEGNDHQMERVRLNKELKYLHYVQKPVDAQTWMQEHVPMTNDTTNYEKESDELCQQWHAKNMNCAHYKQMANSVNEMKIERDLARRQAGWKGSTYTADVAEQLEQDRKKHERILSLSMDHSSMSVIQNNIKNRSPCINVLSLFAGISPETKALLDLGMHVRIYLLDLDADALGVPLAEYADNPRVEFFTIKISSGKNFGDVNDLYNNASKAIQAMQRHCGGLHLCVATPPCQTFSLAGKGEGANVGTGLLFGMCKTIFDHVQKSGWGYPFMVVENTNTSKENKTVQQNTNASWPAPIMCQGANISPFRRS